MRYVLLLFTFYLLFNASSQSTIAFVDFYKVAHHFRYDSLRTLIDESADNFEHYMTHLRDETERYLMHSSSCTLGDPDSSDFEKRVQELDSALSHFMWLCDSAIVNFESETNQYITTINLQLSYDAALFCDQFEYTNLYWEPDSVDSIRQIHPIRNVTDDFLAFLDFHYSE